LKARKLIAKSFRDIIMPQGDGEDMSPAKPVVDAWANPFAQAVPSSLGGRLGRNFLTAAALSDMSCCAASGEP
jgi:hypothetical protein